MKEILCLVLCLGVAAVFAPPPDGMDPDGMDPEGDGGPPGGIPPEVLKMLMRKHCAESPLGCMIIKGLQKRIEALAEMVEEIIEEVEKIEGKLLLLYISPFPTVVPANSDSDLMFIRD